MCGNYENNFLKGKLVFSVVVIHISFQNKKGVSKFRIRLGKISIMTRNLISRFEFRCKNSGGRNGTSFPKIIN